MHSQGSNSSDTTSRIYKAISRNIRTNTAQQRTATQRQQHVSIRRLIVVVFCCAPRVSPLISEIRYVNLSSNELLDLSPLSVLPSLLSLVVSHNHLNSLDSLVATCHPHLQLLQADHNEIEHLLVAAPANPSKKHAPPALTTNFPSLFALTLSNNKLASLLRPEDNAATFAKHGHPTLQVRAEHCVASCRIASHQPQTFCVEIHCVSR